MATNPEVTAEQVQSIRAFVDIEQREYDEIGTLDTVSRTSWKCALDRAAMLLQYIAQQQEAIKWALLDGVLYHQDSGQFRTSVDYHRVICPPKSMQATLLQALERKP